MGTFAVDYAQLHMAGQLLDRQVVHTQAVKQYINAQCRLDKSEFGWLLQMLHPLNEAVVDFGAQGVILVGNVASWAAENTKASLREYLAAEREAYEDAARVAEKLGTPPPAFPVSITDLPELGKAASQADPGYGTSGSAFHADIDQIITGFETAGDGIELVTGTASTGVDRLKNLTDRGGVVERTDPTSYLVPPETPHENVVEELRFKAGIIIGSVDWAAELILGYSVLEEYIFKPFGGDWHAIGRASGAWTHGGRSLMEIGTNFSGLPGQADGWRGSAAEAFQLALAAMSSATVALSYAYDAVSGLVDLVATAAKLACSSIAAALSLLESLLLKIIPQLSIPVAGWITATATAILDIKKVLRVIRLINTAINLLMDAIAEFIAAKEKIVQAVFMAEDLANSAVTRAVRQ